MKFISYRAQGQARYGVVLNDKVVVDIRQCMDQAPASINEFVALAMQPGVLKQVLGRANTQSAVPLNALELLPCIPNPSKIICLGVNYHDHAAEGGNKIVDYPAIFLRVPTSLVAHGGMIPIPPISTALDYEAELALVIGKTTRNVSQERALESVFAYACFNDGSFRDYQKRTSQWTVGKNFDKTGGFGPCLVTADELPPGCQGLHIESRLNGKVMQSDSTSNMVFDVPTTIRLMSECMTLEPGDVIVMGTPAGVGYARKPPVWMKEGDTIEIDIERVGVLRNTVGKLAAV